MAIQQQKVEYIIKGTMNRNSQPEYYPEASEEDLWNMIRFLRDDWYKIEWKPVIKRNEEAEHELKACRWGEKRVQEILKEYYEAQDVAEKRIGA